MFGSYFNSDRDIQPYQKQELSLEMCSTVPQLFMQIITHRQFENSAVLFFIFVFKYYSTHVVAERALFYL